MHCEFTLFATIATAIAAIAGVDDRQWSAGTHVLAEDVVVSSTPATWTAAEGAAVAVSGKLSSPALSAPLWLAGKGEFTFSGDNAALLAPLAATGGVKVVAASDTALGAATRPFTLFATSSGTSATLRELRFSGDRTIATPIVLHNAIGDVNDVGSTLVFKGKFAGHPANTTHTLGFNSNSRVVFEGGVESDGPSRIFFNPRSGTTVTITNLPLRCTLAKSNEFDLNSIGTLQQTPVLELAATGNTWRTLRVFCGKVRCAAAHALCPDGWLQFGRSDWSPQTLPERMTLDLGGHDQALGGLSTAWYVATPDGKTYNPAAAACVTSGAPATLTITPRYGNSGEDGVVYAALRFRGAAALAFAPNATANALTLARQVSDTTGDLRVSSGTLSFAMGAGWAGATNVSVTGTGTLALADAESAAAAFGADGARTTLRLDGQGRLAIPAGCTVTVHNVVFDGVRAYAGTYGGEGSGAEDLSHAAHFAPGGGVLKARLSGDSCVGRLETSSLFEECVDPVSGVKSYLLRRDGLDFHQQSHYFTAKSLTDDGRFLLFKTTANEYDAGKAKAKRNAFVDFATDTVRYFQEDASVFSTPFIDTVRDQVWWVDRYGVHRRDLLEDPDRDIHVADLPPVLAYESGKSYTYGTHITLSPDRRLIFMDAKTDQVLRQGVINLDTGAWEEWGQVRFYCNHGQSSPTAADLAMCAWEYGSYYVTDELAEGELAQWGLQVAPYATWKPRPTGQNADCLYPRIWLFAPGETPWMVKAKLTNYASHEVFTPDGRGIFWCSSGVTMMDLATERQYRISPVGAAHATMTADGRYLTFDCSVNGWWRGCDWTVRFWDRDAHRSCYIHSFNRRMCESDNGSNLHPDPHPQFVCDDRYIVCTKIDGPENPVTQRYMRLSVTPVAPLKAITAAAAVADASKRLEVKGWNAAAFAGKPCELELDTRQVARNLSKVGQSLLVSACEQNGSEFTSYALEAVSGGVTSAVPFEAIQNPNDYRYGATLRFTAPTGVEKLIYVVDPPGRYEYADSELCANLFDRRNIRTYYPFTAAACAPAPAAACAVGAAAGMDCKFELDVRNFAFTGWWGDVRVEQYDAAGGLIGNVLARRYDATGLKAGQRLKIRTTGALSPRAAEVRVYFDGLNDDGSAPQLQLQHLNLRPAFAVSPDAAYVPPVVAEHTTIVVNVPNGATNFLDFATHRGALISNLATNLVKTGGGTLVVTNDLGAYLGDITVKAGTYAFTTNRALGCVAGVNSNLGRVTVEAGAALEARPPKGLSGEPWGRYNKPIRFEGFGPDGRGALIHAGESSVNRVVFGTNLTMTGEAKIANLSSRVTLYQTSSPMPLTMRANTLHLGGTGPMAWGCLNARWAGNIVVEDPIAVTLMNSGSDLGGSAANELAFTGGGTLSFNKLNGPTRWTLDLSGAAKLQVTAGTAETVSTNLSYWEGPVKLGAGARLFDLGKFDFTLRGPVSGGGIQAEGNSLTNARLHLVNGGNSFTGGVAARNTDVYVYADGALPAAGGAVSLAGGDLRFETGETLLTLPALVMDGASRVQGGRGVWQGGVTKTGNGTLAWNSLAGASALTVAGGDVALYADRSRRACAGVLESRRMDFGDDTKAFSKAIDSDLFEVSCTALSPAAYYNREHHLWMDPNPYPGKTNRGIIAYRGYIWNNEPTNVTWSFAGSAYTHLRFYLNGQQVIWWSPEKPNAYSNAVLRPGPNPFKLRGYTGGGGRVSFPNLASELSWPDNTWGFGYDPRGRRSPNQSDYLKLIDPGDGSLLTWCLPEEIVDGVTVPPGQTEPIVRQAVFGEMHFAPGTGLNVTGEACCVATLTGLPVIRGGFVETAQSNQSSIPHPAFRVQHWAVPVAELLAGGRLESVGPVEVGEIHFADPSRLARSGRYLLAISQGTITPPPADKVSGEGGRWQLELSADGHSLYAIHRSFGTKLTVW